MDLRMFPGSGTRNGDLKNLLPPATTWRRKGREGVARARASTTGHTKWPIALLTPPITPPSRPGKYPTATQPATTSAPIRQVLPHPSSHRPMTQNRNANQIKLNITINTSPKM